jgi:modification methylase
MYRIPNERNWPSQFVNTVVQNDALEALRQMPSECVALIVTSPPYWDTVDYGVEGQIGHTDYDQYIAEMVPIWREAARILIPNGKMAVVTPILPVPKSTINNQHTRHLKNINNDIERSVLDGVPSLNLFSLFIWQKQTSKKMFGSYPYPPNIYEDNTIEFINVYVKEGKPPPLDKNIKEKSRLTQQEWVNLTMQVWPIYPEDVTRAGGHPCPFPVVLPQRLIMMYTFARDPESGFAGDIVLDMFNGTGATCVAARALERNWIGIDINPAYCERARFRVQTEPVDPYAIMIKRPRVASPTNSRQLRLFDLGAQNRS